jgi:hydroxyethylthiazole kinase-like uncharacterized protein yjeF
MNNLYSLTQIREIEHAAAANLPAGTLMQRAGLAATRLALELLPVPHGHARVLVLAGPGNNGGDALETAHRLSLSGVQVSVLLIKPPATKDAEAACERAQNSPLQFLDPQLAQESGSHHTSIITSTRWHLVIDGLFGIGLIRPLTGSLRNLVETINRFHCPVLALDVPSGLDADTGNVVGGQQEPGNGHPGIAIRASHTITFIGDKPGLHTCDGRDSAGKVQVAKLDIDHHHFMPSHTWLNDLALFSRLLHHRPHNSHKGTYGNVAVIGGAHGMAGALILAARAALFCGAGRVYAGFISHAPAYDCVQPELMCRQAHEIDFVNATLLVGPGLGSSDSAIELCQQALASTSALVLDADALNLLACDESLQSALGQHHHARILTPHPLEAARLLACTVAEVQLDRLRAARTLAAKFHCTVILKGSGSVIAGSHDKAVINTTGNPALASAGTGDVLAGVCASLLAQGWPEWEAALAATWLHGSAADMLVEQGIGPIGLSASELVQSIRTAFNLLVTEYAQARMAH